tara:strand:- start:948 stop:1358 length:411 start_codon:yes stop_codon:yes gene_type:complete
VILEQHPDYPFFLARRDEGEATLAIHAALHGRRALGYWRSEQEPDFPDPSAFIDEDWDPSQRAEVAAYLARGARVMTFAGYSTCRMCGFARKGDSCLNDERYVWPEGLVHYLEEHGLRPPGEFVRHVLSITRSGRG